MKTEEIINRIGKCDSCKQKKRLVYKRVTKTSYKTYCIDCLQRPKWKAYG